MSVCICVSVCGRGFTPVVIHSQVIHDAGVIHNDLKPENFVLVGGKLKIIDFGIANKIETNATSIQKELYSGTLNYMSPEAVQTNGDNDFFKVPHLC